MDNNKYISKPKQVSEYVYYRQSRYVPSLKNRSDYQKLPFRCRQNKTSADQPQETNTLYFKYINISDENAKEDQL